MLKIQQAPVSCRALRDALRDFLKALGALARVEHAFAEDVVKRAGWELADLIATTAGLFGATNVITGGGPLSGFVGRSCGLLLAEH